MPPPSAATRQRRGRITSASSTATRPSVATWLPIATRGWTPGSVLVAVQSNRNDSGHVDLVVLSGGRETDHRHDDENRRDQRRLQKHVAPERGRGRRLRCPRPRRREPATPDEKVPRRQGNERSEEDQLEEQPAPVRGPDEGGHSAHLLPGGVGPRHGEDRDRAEAEPRESLGGLHGGGGARKTARPCEAERERDEAARPHAGRQEVEPIERHRKRAALGGGGVAGHGAEDQAGGRQGEGLESQREPVGLPILARQEKERRQEGQESHPG